MITFVKFFFFYVFNGQINVCLITACLKEQILHLILFMSWMTRSNRFLSIFSAPQGTKGITPQAAPPMEMSFFHMSVHDDKRQTKDAPLGRAIKYSSGNPRQVLISDVSRTLSFERQFAVFRAPSLTPLRKQRRLSFTPSHKSFTAWLLIT